MTIAEHRKKNGMTQIGLAEELGVTPSAVCLWEANKTTPRMDMFKRMAALFNCTVDELLSD